MLTRYRLCMNGKPTIEEVHAVYETDKYLHFCHESFGSEQWKVKKESKYFKHFKSREDAMLYLSMTNVEQG